MNKTNKVPVVLDCNREDCTHAGHTIWVDRPSQKWEDSDILKVIKSQLHALAIHNGNVPEDELTYGELLDLIKSVEAQQLARIEKIVESKMGYEESLPQDELLKQILEEIRDENSPH